MIICLANYAQYLVPVPKASAATSPVPAQITDPIANVVLTPPNRRSEPLPPHLHRVSQDFDCKMTVAEKEAHDRRQAEQQESSPEGSTNPMEVQQDSPWFPSAYAAGAPTLQPWCIDDLNLDWRRQETIVAPEESEDEDSQSSSTLSVTKLVTTNPEFTGGNTSQGYRRFEDVTSVTFCKVKVRSRGAQSTYQQSKALATAINPLRTILAAVDMSPVLFPLSIEHHYKGPAMFPLSLSFEDQKLYFSRVMPVLPNGTVCTLRFGILLGLKGDFSIAKAALQEAFESDTNVSQIEIWEDPLQLQHSVPVCWMMFSGMEMNGINWKEQFEPILCRKIGYNYRRIFGLNVEYDGNGRDSKPRPTLYLYAEAYHRETILDRLQELYSSFENSSSWPLGVFLVPLPVLDANADSEQITQMKDLAKRHHKWQVKHNRKQQTGIKYQNLNVPIPQANNMTLFQLLMAVTWLFPPAQGSHLVKSSSSPSWNLFVEAATRTRTGFCSITLQLFENRPHALSSTWCHGSGTRIVRCMIKRADYSTNASGARSMVLNGTLFAFLPSCH
jgi:hypothetical protein